MLTLPFDSLFQVITELKSYDTIKSSSVSGGGPIAFDIAARKKRMIWWPYPTYYGGSDAFTVFEVGHK